MPAPSAQVAIRASSLQKLHCLFLTPRLEVRVVSCSRSRASCSLEASHTALALVGLRCVPCGNPKGAQGTDDDGDDDETIPTLTWREGVSLCFVPPTGSNFFPFARYILQEISMCFRSLAASTCGCISLALADPCLEPPPGIMIPPLEVSPKANSCRDVLLLSRVVPS